MSKTGLDNRHRNKDGEISGKHGNTLALWGRYLLGTLTLGEARRARN